MAAGRYEFELSEDGAVAPSRRSLFLPNLAAAWPVVSSMAIVAPRGAKIRVRDEEGRIVILTGVIAARILARHVSAI